MSIEETVPIEAAVAIIGMAGRFPGAPTLTQFWENLAAGVEAISQFTDEELLAAGVTSEMLQNSGFVRAGGVIEQEDMFAAEFFGYTPREAEITAPQHRLFLECAWQALEDAGYVSDTYAGNIGVFAGMNFNNYLLNNIYSNSELVQAMGVYQLSLSNAEAFLCTRTSYKLNLTGPSVAVQTACSTALVATAMAYLNLLNYQADMALAGGVTVWSPQKTGYLYQEGGVVSPDGHTRTFDAKAQGSVGGNGVGVVLLKRLEDALAEGDHIYAIIRGAAVNNDGAMKVGYTAPSIDAQTEVILAAQALADVDVETISYIEAHGTATALGDPVEIAALTRAFRESTEKTGFCGVGAVKTSIGHLDAAAGIAGLIKTTLALTHKQIPPSLNFETPNPQIDFENSPFYVNTTLQDWAANGHPRRAGVNSLGIGGTNAHVVLEEAPPRPLRRPARPAYPLVLSAQTESALRQMARNLRQHLQENPDVNLADVAYTLLVGRKAFAQRQTVVADSIETAITTLGKVETAVACQQGRTVAFVFPDAGSVQVNSGQALYKHEPVFRETVDKCSRLLQDSLGKPLLDVLYPPVEQEMAAAALLTEARWAQPAAFVFGYALAQMWLAWGLEPQAMAGQGVGEYVAACVAGVYSLEAALTLVAVRGQLTQNMPKQPHLEVALSESECRSLLGEAVALTAVISPTTCILVGAETEIEALATELTANDIVTRRLPALDAAYSPFIEPVLPEFSDRLDLYDRQAPQIPFLSNVTGDWITDEEARDDKYWLNQLRQPLRLRENLESLAQITDWVVLVMGVGDDLVQAARLNGVETAVATLTDATEDAYQTVLQAWGQLWAHGVEVDIGGFFADDPRYRVPLPTYPFERQRYWIEPRPWNKADEISAATVKTADPDLETYADAPRNKLEQLLAQTWTQLLGIPQIGIHQNFFQIGGNSLMSLQVVTKIQEAGYQVSPQMLLENQTIATLAAAIAPALSLMAQAASPRHPDMAKTTTAVSLRPRLDVKRFADTFERKPPIVCLQAGSPEKTPLFLVPPANGNLFAYRRLVNHLNDETQPVYALMAVYENIMTADRLTAVARQYLEVMKSVQPKGPYNLIGWSAGGPFAFEIAQQLRRRTDPVGLVGIIDSSVGKDSLAIMQLVQGLIQSSPRLARWYHANIFFSRWFVVGLAHAALQTQREEVMSQLQRYNRAAILMIYVRWLEDALGVQSGLEAETFHGLETRAQITLLRSRLEAEGAQVKEIVWENIAHWVDMTLRMSELIDGYEPEIFPGRIDYVHAIEPTPDDPNHSRGKVIDETMGVGAVSQDIVVYRTPGDHFTMMDDPNVRVLALKIQQMLADAQAAPAWGLNRQPPPVASKRRRWILLSAVIAMILMLMVLAQALVGQ